MNGPASISDLRINQTMQSTDLTRPFVGRVWGIDSVGPVAGRPRVLLRSDSGERRVVHESDLKNWMVLGGEG